MSSREELFKKANEARVVQKAEEESRKNNSYSFDAVPYDALIPGKDKVVRLYGLPIQNREEGCDPKLIEITPLIKGDDQKYFRCVWPLRKDQPSWLLRSVLNYVLDSTWEGATQIFNHKTKYPSFVERVATNNQPDNPYAKGWRPNQIVLMNHINRDPEAYAWHKENKSFRVLSKKMSVSGETTYYDVGIPLMTYNMLFDNVIEFHGYSWEAYDILFKKFAVTPYYSVAKASSRLEEMDKALVPHISSLGNFTEEELSWKRSDFDKLFPITKLAKIKLKLGVFIASVDAAFGTKFLPELDALVETEKIADALAKEKAVDTANPTQPTAYTTPVVEVVKPILAQPISVPITKTPSPNPAVQEIPVVAPVSRQPVSTTSPTPAMTDFSTWYEKYPGLEENDAVALQRLISGIDDTGIHYVLIDPVSQQKVKKSECGQCKHVFPYELTICPNCNAHFA